MSASAPPRSQKRPSASDLPIPSAEARAHSTQLMEKLHSMIGAHGGRIAFETYMNACLYLPQLGYYRCGTEKFGAGGDFITAAEESPLFAHCLARFKSRVACANQILEVGAGSGKLAAGILAWLAQHNALPDHYFILELSPELRRRQQQTLSASVPKLLERVVWLDDIPDQFSGLVIANELLDAMPVKRFRRKDGKLYEQYVTWRDGVLCYEDVLASDPRLQARVDELIAAGHIDANSPYLSEVNFVAEDWLRTLGEKLHAGVVLLLDYGYPRNAYYHAQRQMGTLMCHFRHHAHPDPLILPGIQDITAHIDFTAMADAALDVGMEIAGFTTQGYFLMNMDVLNALDVQQSHTAQYVQLANEVKKLTLPGEMGEKFKVLALSKGLEVELPGFESHDLRHLL